MLHLCARQGSYDRKAVDQKVLAEQSPRQSKEFRVGVQVRRQIWPFHCDGHLDPSITDLVPVGGTSDVRELAKIFCPQFIGERGVEDVLEHDIAISRKLRR